MRHDGRISAEAYRSQWEAGRRAQRRRTIAIAAGIVGAVLLLSVVVMAAYVWLSVYSCEQRWPDAMQRWTPAAGCQVQTDEGWVPEGAYRVLD